MSITLPALRRYPTVVRFKASAGADAGIVAAMTGTGTGIVLFLPATGATGASGASGASGANPATPLNSRSMFEFISIDPTLVDDYAGVLSINGSTGTVTVT